MTDLIVLSGTCDTVPDDLLAAHLRSARTETLSDLADTLRSRAGELMRTHPSAATHLVLAAASIAPTCPDEEMVAEYYAELTAPLTQQLAGIHHRRTAVASWSLRRRRDGAR